jgi:hypothetical protein
MLLNYIKNCLHTKTILPWCAGLVSNEDLTEEEYDYPNRIKYPCRCRILDIAGAVIDPLFPEIVAATPTNSKPYIGEEGLAELLDEWTVRITLDSGNIIYGYECWWTPIG